MTLQSSRSRPGWWYPYIYVAVFLVVFAVNAILAISAVRTFSGLDTEDAYEKGLHYNRTLAEARQEKALGWSARIDLQPEPSPGAGQRAVDLVAEMADKSGLPLDGLSVEAKIIRPAISGHDQEVVLTPIAEGRYGSRLVLPFPGLWEIRMTARRGDLVTHALRRVTLP